MPDMSKNLKRWVNFAGCVLVIAVLYWAQAVLIPVALAVLISFVLTPPTVKLQKWIGHVPAVLVTVALAFSVLGLAGWGLATQMGALTADLPAYRQNIRQKISDIRQAGKGSSIEKVQDTIEEIKTEIEKSDGPQEIPAQPVVVRPERVGSLWGFPAWLGPVLGPLTTAGLVIVMVIFILVERDDLRGRLIGLVGHGHLAVTTKAFDEAGRRVSRQLLMQTCVSAIYGLGVGIGLYLMGVPYALLWAGLASLCRFIPYVGPFIGAAAPILVALAAFPGWTQPLWVMGLFLGLELFTNLVLETVLYAGAAGVSQVGLLISLAFWTWLWGSMGLVMATPLTVCLVVLGKHVPGLDFLSKLMAESPEIEPDMRYYQRLLAHDPSEASDFIDQHIKAQSLESVYDALLLPALNYAERDRLENRLTAEEESAVVDATRELMSDAAVASRAARLARTNGAVTTTAEHAAPGVERVTVLALPANATSDELALHMFNQLLEDTAVVLDVVSGHMLASEIIAKVQEHGYKAVCIADLPPSPPSKTRYLIKKLRYALPELKIVVGRWAPPALADEHSRALLEAGADFVGSTLMETRDQLCQIALLEQRPADEA
jgi:predicted PurR-regulated permease PerM